ncbi:hypothetical protein [Thioclava sp. GXIMD4215]|uniref:hypothetical protein n=1 Tax=Thioclava sp. GXIMD4215 TaxID=3131928 RepID=UPI0032434FB8
MMQTESFRHIPWVFALFWGALLAAAGYGATFILTRHFIAFGGSEIDTGTVLAVAVAGTFLSLPITGTFATSFGPARCAAVGVGLVALAFALIALSESADVLGSAGGFALGCGWGAFYLAAPMALSRLVDDAVRAYWFRRRSAPNPKLPRPCQGFAATALGRSQPETALPLDVSGLHFITFYECKRLAVSVCRNSTKARTRTGMKCAEG